MWLILANYPGSDYEDSKQFGIWNAEGNMKAKSSPLVVNGTTRTRKRHPTYDRLVFSTLELMKDFLPEEISTEMVLQHSGVSRGSLYHHFEDLNDLLETAMVAFFSDAVDRNIALIGGLINEATSSSDFYRATEHFNQVTQARERRDVRFERIRLIGFSYKNPRLTSKLAAEQARLTDSYAQLFCTAQAKGWMNDDFDPLAAAILIQAYTLGKVVDDLVANPVDPADWNSIIMKIVVRVFGVAPA